MKSSRSVIKLHWLHSCFVYPFKRTDSLVWESVELRWLRGMCLVCWISLCWSCCVLCFSLPRLTLLLPVSLFLSSIFLFFSSSLSLSCGLSQFLSLSSSFPSLFLWYDLDLLASTWTSVCVLLRPTLRDVFWVN